MDEKIAAGRKDWESRFLKKPPEKIESTSGMDIYIVYSPAEIPDFNYLTDIGFPGEYPFTRGIQLSRSQ
jgi:methylmalonyl-CoA mutase N-terminal domain/subunit